MLTIPSISKNVEQPEPSCAAGGKIKWSDHFGKFGIFFKS